MQLIESGKINITATYSESGASVDMTETFLNMLKLIISLNKIINGS